MTGWHWIREERRLDYNDGREVRVGETLTVDVTPTLCQAGLHASERAIDSLDYAPGPIICRVLLSGNIVRGADKAAATERTVLAMADATNVLHTFACDCAERALLREREAGREPDPRSWVAVETKRRWLRGEATAEELDAACAAASAAAWAAACAAAWAAARAARAAAWEARDARAAARAAARDAACAAARAAARAARAAAWEARDAARDAEREWQNARLETLLREILGPCE